MKDQRRLPSLFLTLVLCVSPWSTSGKTFYSYYGIKCTDDCHPRGFMGLLLTYQCTVRKTDGTEELQYCSPKSGVDYKGNMCSDCCEQHKKSYYWCKTASDWGYCGDVIEDLNHYTSTYGMPCYDSCETHSENYYWCHSTKGWDYCSPSKNVDYKGNTCRQNHPCDTHGEDYHWCYLDKGGWDKCGRVEPKAVIHDTKYRKHCTDDCQYSDYFWCHTRDGWDHCSPTPDVTYRGVPCRSDHNCGDHDEGYNWCYTTDNNDWDYCGVISPGECRYSVPRRTKRKPKKPNQTNPPQVICTQEDIDNNRRRVTTFVATENNRTIADSQNYREDAFNLIDQWDGLGLAQNSRYTVVSSSNLRIDLQGGFNRNNQWHYNVQLQVNTQRRSGQSTTLAHIEVPNNTPPQYNLLALRQSLQHRARVSLQVTDQPINNNNNNNKSCRKRH